MFKRPSVRLLCLLPFLISLLTACGGGGSAPSATAGMTGSVGMMLTDAPADPSLFTAINATIERVELIGGDGARVALFEGPAETVDLLQLRHESVPFSFRDDVPVGSYCKVRLTLSRPDGLELVLAADGSSYYPKLPGNGKLDLLARDCFTVAPGASVTLQLDLDAGNSIHIVQTGNKTDYNFRPVIFIDVINGSFGGRLVRLEGIVADYDATAQSLLLCDALPTHQNNGNDCVAVELGTDSAFFDNLSLGGDAAPLGDLLQDSNLGQAAAVVGLVRDLTVELVPPALPTDALPGAGLCRLWDPAVEATSQPYPDDVACADPTLRVPAGMLLVDDRGVVVVDHRPRLALAGLAVETGSFAQVHGNAATDATADGFMAAAPDPLAVTLQNPSGYNGTRILSKAGAVLDYTAIVAPRALKLDGVLLSPSELQAAVVIVDADTAGRVLASGIAASVTNAGFTLMPDQGTAPCGVNGDLLVTWSGGVDRMLRLTITDSQVEVSPDGAVGVGDAVQVTGRCDNGVLSAESIVIVNDQSQSN